MQHLSTETYNIEYDSMVFIQNFSWTMPKNGLFCQ